MRRRIYLDGGLASQAWADAVNRAYAAGMILVAASGNNFKVTGPLPTRHVVYPSRFNRVITVCGATYDHAPYATNELMEMQGNWGLASVMKRVFSE